MRKNLVLVLLLSASGYSSFLPDGAYPTSRCSNQYVLRHQNSSRLLNCPTPLLFDPNLQRCSWRSEILECACESKTDGVYSVGKCSQRFLGCSNSVGRLLECPARLVFEPEISRCEFAGKCSDETKGNDDFYSSEHCSSVFTAHTNGKKILMFCPNGLKFSKKSKMCDYWYNVDECSRYEEEEPSPGDGLTPCSNLENGLYALDCSPRVLSCQNGRERIYECPPSLVFNEQSLVCDYPETSLKCNSEDTLLLRNNSIRTDCSLDGFFSDRTCSNSFKKCSNGKLMNLKCSDPNHIYSEIHAECVTSKFCYSLNRKHKHF